MFERLSHLEPKHWLLIAAFLASISTILSGVNSWGELLKPQIVGGLIGLLAVQIGSIFAGAPKNPNTTAANNPGRRSSDPDPDSGGDRAVVPVILLAVGLASLAGCGANPDPRLTPVGRTAVEARAVIKAADAVVVGIDNAMTAKQLPVPIGVKVLEGIKVVGVQARTLADALDVAAAATDAAAKQAGMDKARAALAAIQTALTAATSPITDPAAKAQVGTILQQLVDSVLKVQQLIGLVRSEPVPLLQAEFQN